MFPLWPLAVLLITVVANDFAMPIQAATLTQRHGPIHLWRRGREVYPLCGAACACGKQSSEAAHLTVRWEFKMPQSSILEKCSVIWPWLEEVNNYSSVSWDWKIFIVLHLGTLGSTHSRRNHLWYYQVISNWPCAIINPVKQLTSTKDVMAQKMTMIN